VRKKRFLITVQLCHSAGGSRKTWAVFTHIQRDTSKIRQELHIGGNQQVRHSARHNLLRMTSCIYALIDPRDGQVRYVGKTTIGLSRARQHAQPCYLRRDKGHKANWIRTLIAAGLTYSIVCLYEAPTAEYLDDAEVFWIAEMRRRGCKLTNATAGGEGWRAGMKHSAETRALMAERQRGKRHTEETRLLISRVQQGKCTRPETRAKQSAALKGRPKSPEHRAALSRAALGRKHSEESKRKMSVSHTGKPHPNRGRRRNLKDAP
jgi:hypothetical protein